jgi:hypothetical protein
MNSSGTQTISTAASTDPVVATGPGGPRRADLFHQVDPGHRVEAVGGQWRIVDERTGALVQDITPARQLAGLGEEQPKGDTPSTTPGWIADAIWYLSAGQQVTSFTTSWVVPPAPQQPAAGETVYLFNAFQAKEVSGDPSQAGTHIFQPVLQWGPSAAGGGSYWCVASWYVGAQGQPVSFTKPVQVSPGQVLTGVITLTGQGNGTYTYKCAFTGIAGTTLSVTIDAEPYMVAETLECYGTSARGNYPAAESTAMYDIAVQINGQPATPNWTLSSPFEPVGQHIFAGARAADIFYEFSNPPGTVGAVFRAGTDNWEVMSDYSYEYFTEAAFGQAVSNGLEPVHVHSTKSAYGDPRYGGFFRSGTGQAEVVWGDSYAYFTGTRWPALIAAGLRPVQCWASADGQHFGGLFRPGTDQAEVVWGDSYDYFTNTRWPALIRAGLRPVQCWAAPDGQHFGGLFRSGTDQAEVVWGDSYDYFTSTRLPALVAAGLRPVQAWVSPDGQRFGGLFRSGTDNYDIVWSDSVSYFLNTRLSQETARGLRPVSCFFNPAALTN